jgi:hypothetical protein
MCVVNFEKLPETSIKRNISFFFHTSQPQVENFIPLAF